MYYCCQTKAKTNYPNVRTLNTLLRGCLWCAVNISKDGVLVGGVVSAEMAWSKYKGLNVADKNQANCTALDISSYEYSITLLCQALRVEDAMTRIAEMKLAFGVPEKEIESSDDQSLMEGLAVAYCALARAYTILKKEEEAVGACKTSLHFAKVSKDALKSSGSYSSK